MKTRLLCTVGISLYNKLKYSETDWFNMNPHDIAQKLREDNKGKEACAEIASIQSILKNNLLDQAGELYLLVSDTEQGVFSGEVIEGYFKNVFESVKLIKVRGLNAEDMDVFREEGLRQLVKAVSEIIYSAKRQKESCIINATGGYKAQISFVALMGAVLKIPVFYQFEDFKSIVELPNMPVSLDSHLWLNHYEMFDKLFKYGSLPSHQIDEELIKNENLKDLLDENSGQYRLSSVGVLMHEVMMQQFTYEGHLHLPKKVDEKGPFPRKKGISNFPDLIPLSLETLLSTILTFEYIVDISFSHIKENFSGRTHFKRLSEQKGKVEGSFYDGKHTWFFTIQTTAEKTRDEYATVVDLNLRFTNPFEKPKPANVEFLLIRHGQHTGEKDGRIEGWANFELTETGLEQAHLVAEKLKTTYKIDAIYTSSLLRARQTADVIGKKIKVAPKQLDDLRAMNYGLSGGLKKYEASILFPKTRDSHYLTNKSWGRENEIEFSKRVLETFYDIYYAHPGETIAIVTHGRAISTILREILRLPISHDFRVGAEDTSIHHIEMSPEKTEIHTLNNIEHLKSEFYVGEVGE